MELDMIVRSIEDIGISSRKLRELVHTVEVYGENKPYSLDPSKIPEGYYTLSAAAILLSAVDSRFSRYLALNNLIWTKRIAVSTKVKFSSDEVLITKDELIRISRRPMGVQMYSRQEIMARFGIDEVQLKELIRDRILSEDNFNMISSARAIKLYDRIRPPHYYRNRDLEYKANSSIDRTKKYGNDELVPAYIAMKEIAKAAKLKFVNVTDFRYYAEKQGVRFSNGSKILGRDVDYLIQKAHEVINGLNRK